MLLARPTFCPAAGAWAPEACANSISPATIQIARFMNVSFQQTLKTRQAKVRLHAKHKIEIPRFADLHRIASPTSFDRAEKYPSRCLRNVLPCRLSRGRQLWLFPHELPPRSARHTIADEARLAVGLASSAMRRRGSELEPQRELDLALAVRGFWNDSGRACNLIARENDQLGVCEVRMIEDVEGLDPELHVQPLLQRNPLEQRGVHVEETGSPKRAARDVSVGPGQRQHERVGI